MSTLQHTTRHRHRIRTEALALGALIAIGLALLILIPTGHHTTRPPTASIAHPAVPAALTTEASGLDNCSLACYQAASYPDTPEAAVGYFRDPATHKLLRLRAAPQPAGQHRASHSRGRIVP